MCKVSTDSMGSVPGASFYRGLGGQEKGRGVGGGGGGEKARYRRRKQKGKRVG